MHIIMGGESLLGARTGIGNYTSNLSRALLDSGRISTLEFFVHARLTPWETLLLSDAAASSAILGHPTGPVKSGHLLQSLRTRLAKVPIAVWAYQRIMPRIERARLGKVAETALFHSPNYFIPEFPGRRVVSIPDLSTWRYPEWHTPASVRLVNHHIEKSVKEADHIITISHRIKAELMQDFGLSDQQITVTYLAADESYRPVSAETFHANAPCPGVEFKNYFVFVSTIEPRKNLDRLLNAYLHYRAGEGETALPLLICGHEGWKSGEVHERLKHLATQGHVRYLGYLPQHSLPLLIGGARALLYPTLYEGFGLPVLEAMQAGTAVMTTCNTAAAEIAGEAACCIDAESEDEMAEAMRSLHHDQDKLDVLVTRGLERAACFSWEACASATIAVYDRVLSGRTR